MFEEPFVARERGRDRRDPVLDRLELHFSADEHDARDADALALQLRTRIAARR